MGDQEEKKPLKVKLFFKSIRKSYIELRCLDEQRERLFTMMTSTTLAPKEISVQTSGQEDKMSKVVPRMMKLDELIGDQIQRIVEKQLAAEQIIKQIKNMKYRETLRWYYVQNLKWGEVADRMHYDVTYIQRLNGEALLEAENIFNKLLDDEKDQDYKEVGKPYLRTIEDFLENEIEDFLENEK